MKVRAATVPVAGVAALAASVMLAGCGSGSKTASSSSGSAASTTTSASSTSAAAPSAAAQSTKAGPPGAPTVTLPNLPGWVGDPATLSEPAGKDSPTVEAQYVMALKPSQGEGGLLVIVQRPKTSSDTLDLDAWLQGNLPPDAKPDKDCEFVAPPVKTTVSGFNAVANNQRCTGADGTHELDFRYVAVPGTNGAPNYGVTLLVGGLNLADTMKLIDEQIKITAGQ